MNKPEPMTDETLEAIWNSDTTDPSDHGSFYYVKVLANAIIAARDAQWEQMLAGQEPDDIAAAMGAVADEFAHKLALDLECILAEYSGKWYDTAIDTLGKYRAAMREIHETISPTFMGEPLYAAPQPAQEPVAHRVVAGAIYDMMGWLTSRRSRLVLSDKDNAVPAADAIVDFAKMRGLKLDDADVNDWQKALQLAAPQPAQPSITRLMEAAASASSAGLVYGTSNWAAHVHKWLKGAKQEEKK